MARSYKFAVIQLKSAKSRDERLNVGVAILNDGALDVRTGKRMDKIHAISSALDSDQLRLLLDSLAAADERLKDSVSDPRERLSILFKGGPIAVSDLGTFAASTAADYETRVSSILKALVEAEPAPLKVRDKRSRLLTQVKKAFRHERVLAKPGETIDSHRLVQDYNIDEGLTADLVLRNGAMHVVETVDASGDQESFRRAVSEIAVSALVLERARMKFGENNTKSRLVYSASATLEKAALPSLDAAAHQGTQLINWASAQDQSAFIHSMTSLAEPIPKKRPGRAPRAAFAAPGGLF